jgi:hypothetical protein
MPYQFQTKNFGKCRMTNRTSGKYGFGLPKFFLIESMDQPGLGRFTYRYTDTVVSGAHGVRFSNAVLCGIAISQFLASAPFRDGAATTLETLDVTLQPYREQVLNSKARSLTRRQFMRYG